MAMIHLKFMYVPLTKDGKNLIGYYNTASNYGRVEDPVKDVVVDYIESNKTFSPEDFESAGYSVGIPQRESMDF